MALSNEESIHKKDILVFKVNDWMNEEEKAEFAYRIRQKLESDNLKTLVVFDQKGEGTQIQYINRNGCIFKKIITIIKAKWHTLKRK